MGRYTSTDGQPIEPGSCAGDAPDAVIRDGESGCHIAIFFRSDNQPPPQRWDISVPHRSAKGMRVFYLFLAVIVVIAACLS